MKGFLNLGIYKGCDIRGVYNKELNDAFAFKVARAFQKLLSGKRFVVGGDTRFSTESLKKEIINGFIKSGAEVYDIGRATTPLLYFAVKKLNCDGGIMITASHNAPEYNGFKMCKGIFTIMDKEIVRLRQYIEENNFKDSRGNAEKYNILPDYYSFLKKNLKLKRKLKIVVDFQNSVCAEVNDTLFNSPLLEVIKINDCPDPYYKKHPPDPSVEEYVAEAKEAVVKYNADMGIVFDGDGDRAVYIDDKGRIVASDKSLALFIKYLFKKDGPGKVIYDIKCSLMIKDIVSEMGGEALIGKTGHAYMKRRVYEEDIRVAGEYSGHYYFKETGYDDGLFAALLMCAIVAESDIPMSVMVDALPEYNALPEYRFKYEGKDKFDIIENLKEEFKNEDVCSIDGVRVHFHDGWALMRASNTEPKITLRFESKKGVDPVSIVKKFLGKNKKILDMVLKKI